MYSREMKLLGFILTFIFLFKGLEAKIIRPDPVMGGNKNLKR
jgi:hypothetical protein